jgi:hypothetical protein
MTFQEALKEIVSGGAGFDDCDTIKALAEQIEANRLAILELRKAARPFYRAGVDDARLGPQNITEAGCDLVQATGDSSQETVARTEAAKILDAMEVLNRERA